MENMADSSFWQSFRRMDQFIERIYIGQCADAEDAEKLLGHGITAVVNLTQDDFIVHDGIKTLKLGQSDAEGISHQTIRKFLTWMDETWDEGHTILIHCHAGISRTPSFLICWMMHRRGCNKDSDLRSEWSLFEDQIKLTRPIIQPHYALKRSILNYFEAIAS